MCGIFAAVAPHGHAACRFAPRAVELLKHRGPDAQGTQHVELPWASVTLGMSRLKVVDQRDLAVPFDFRENFGIVLAFNGEIYNWRELRAIFSPAPWSTDCDAEVLAAAWRRHGVDCLHELNGMFAFVLVDTVRNEVYAVRDRAGEKPLYWARRGDVIYYASEPKALPIALGECSCPDMDALEFDFGRHTPLEHVFVLPPGEYQAIHDNGVRSEHAWWKLPTELPACGLPPHKQDALVHEARELFVDAVWLRHVAERKVAIQLSGGLDSAMTQAVARCAHPYCVTFPDLDSLTAARAAVIPMNATGYERDAAARHIVPVTFTRDELLAALPEVAYYLDTPATWTAVCQWFLNKRIAADGGVVVLSGEGADELFGGYARYRVLHYLDAMDCDPHLDGYGPLIQRTFDGEPSGVLASMLNRGGVETLPWAKLLVLTHGGQGTLVRRMMRADFYTTMQVLVRMADRMAAAFGMENRSPFFDYRLMELAARISSEHHVTENESKHILRRTARLLSVHYDITGEKVKRGLTVPKSWGNGSDWSRDWFAREMLDAWRKACLRPALCTECGGTT